MAAENNNIFFDLIEDNELVFNTVAEIKVFFSSSANCTCLRPRKLKNFCPCFEKIGFRHFFKCLINLKALDKKEMDLFIKTQLMIGDLSGRSNDGNSTKKITRYCYNFNGSIKICQTVFMKLCGIKKEVFDNIKDHYKKFGLDECIHGNTGHRPEWNSKVTITEEISISVKNFLENYGYNAKLFIWIK